MRRRDRDDEGFTLVELLIYMMLAITVVTIVGGMLINSLRAESAVRAAAAAADTAQLAAQSLNRGVHNASAIEVSAPASGIHLVRTRSIDSSQNGAWRCEAWVVADGALRTTTSASAIAPPLSAADAASWTLVTSGVRVVGTTPLFALAADQRSLSVTFTVDNGQGVPVLLDTTIVSRQPTPVTGRESAPCF